MNQPAITEAALAELWGVVPDTWYLAVRSQGFIEPDERSGNAYIYYYTTVDDYLRRQSSSCKAPLPTIAELAADVHAYGLSAKKLLSPEAAAKRIGCAEHDVRYYAARGAIGSIRLGNPNSSIRIPSTEVTVFKARRRNSDALKLGDACTILCRERREVRALLDTDVLTYVDVPASGPQTYVSRSSLLRYLRGELHEDIDVIWWYQQQKAFGDEGWLSKSGLRVELKLAPETVSRALETGALAGIRLRKEWRIPRWAARLYAEQVRLLTADDLNRIFGVTQETAQQWLDTRALCRLKHNRSACLRQTCVHGYIAAHRTSEKVDPEEWVRLTRFDGADAVVDVALLREARASEDDLEEALAEERLVGVRLPDNSYSFLRMHTVAFARSMRMRERRLFGPDDNRRRLDEYLG